MANVVDLDQITFDPLPVEDGWTTKSILPTPWKACSSCQYVFDPYNQDRLLVAFTEEMDEVVQFTNSAGANLFTIMLQSRKKNARADMHWRWMEGMRPKPGNPLAYGPSDAIQAGKVRHIVDQHQQHVKKPHVGTGIGVGAPARTSAKGDDQLLSAPRSPQFANTRTRRQRVVETPRIAPTVNSSRPKSIHSRARSSRQRKRDFRSTVPTSNVRLEHANTPKARHGGDRLESTDQAPRASEKVATTVDPVVQNALDVMWASARQIAAENPSRLKEILSAGMEIQLSYIKK